MVPFSISKSITPNDQISALYEYSVFYTTYGAIYKGVPQIVWLIYYKLLSFFEKPKSAILTSNLVYVKSTFYMNLYFSSGFIFIRLSTSSGKWTIIFWSLRSLWMTSTEIMSLNPRTSCFIIVWIISELKLHFLISIRSFKSPPLQYSINI